MPAPPAVTSTRSPLAEVSMPGDNSAGLGESVPLNDRKSTPGYRIEQEELRGISRTVAEIHWLLLILVLLYLDLQRRARRRRDLGGDQRRAVLLRRAGDVRSATRTSTSARRAGRSPSRPAA